LTQIELFRFIGFHFVQKRGGVRFADSRVRANLRRGKIGENKGDHDETSLRGEPDALDARNFIFGGRRSVFDSCSGEQSIRGG
jgi:hypothetical protein